MSRENDLEFIREHVSSAAASVYRCKEYEGHNFAYMARQRGEGPARIRTLFMKAERVLRDRPNQERGIEHDY